MKLENEIAVKIPEILSKSLQKQEKQLQEKHQLEVEDMKAEVEDRMLILKKEMQQLQ